MSEIDLTTSRLNHFLHSEANKIVDTVNSIIFDAWSQINEFCQSYESIYTTFAISNYLEVRKYAQDDSTNKFISERGELLKKGIISLQDHLKYGNLSLLAGDFLHALLAYSSCLQHSSGLSYFQKYLIFVCLTHYNMFETALNLIENILQYLPAEIQFDALFRTSICLRNVKRYKSSLELFLKLSSISSGASKITLAIEIAESYLLLGEYEEAINFLSQFDSDLSADLVTEQCYIMFLSDKKEFCEKAIQIGLSSSFASLSASLQYVCIRLLYKTNRFVDALQCIKVLLHKRPQYAEVWFTLGLIYTFGAQFDEALHSFQKSILFKPNLIEAWANIGTIFEMNPEKGDAMQLYKKAMDVTKAQVYFRQKIELLDSSVENKHVFVELNDLDYFISPGKEQEIEYLKKVPVIPQNLLTLI